MHIKDKLAEAESTGRPMFSFEFFPPKTEQVSSIRISAHISTLLSACVGRPESL